MSKKTSNRELRQAPASPTAFEPAIYQQTRVLKQLSSDKFPVYLIHSQINDKKYAMKVFPHEDDEPHASYQNEARFSDLLHPHVVKTYYQEDERKSVISGIIVSVSYKVMEYAPYGTLFDFVTKYDRFLDDKLIRTYFRQMIEGLEYLHSHGISHMDIKLENLLLGEDFKLKIADFDMSCVEGDRRKITKGTRFFRAPEVIQGDCTNTKAADIYSAGVVLFTLKSQGVLPHSENRLVDAVDLSYLLYNDPRQFWDEHCEMQDRDHLFFNKDFKELFIAMMEFDPKSRVTIQGIKESKWYNGPVFNGEELNHKMQRLLVD